MDSKKKTSPERTLILNEKVQKIERGGNTFQYYC